MGKCPECMECPTPCPWCGSVVELDDMVPIDRASGCGDLICKQCDEKRGPDTSDHEVGR